MKTTALLMFLGLLAVTATVTSQPRGDGKFAAPDGGAYAVITPARHDSGSGYESRIELRSADGKVSCTSDYSSEDGQHGFIVQKAEWTPDSRYFVFSLSSSGGHQAWHAPTEFISRNDGMVRSLDDYFDAAGISNADFQIVAPNTVKVEVKHGNPDGSPVSLSLGALPPLRSWRKSKPFGIDCTGARIVKPEQP